MPRPGVRPERWAPSPAPSLPPPLPQVVVHLEQDMVAAESHVAYDNDATEQQRLDKLNADGQWLR